MEKDAEICKPYFPFKFAVDALALGESNLKSFKIHGVKFVLMRAETFNKVQSGELKFDV